METFTDTNVHKKKNLKWIFAGVNFCEWRNKRNFTVSILANRIFEQKCTQYTPYLQCLQSHSQASFKNNFHFTIFHDLEGENIQWRTFSLMAYWLRFCRIDFWQMIQTCENFYLWISELRFPMIMSNIVWPTSNTSDPDITELILSVVVLLGTIS